jgi:hypothetical protein
MENPGTPMSLAADTAPTTPFAADLEWERLNTVRKKERTREAEMNRRFSRETL